MGGGIGIIHNPFAKGNLRRPWIAEKIKTILGDRGVLRETKNINELPEVAQDFKKRKIEIIAVNGGDGSLHLVLSAFVNAYGAEPLPKIMSLRGGTMNTVSNSLKIKGGTLEIIENAVAAFAAGEAFHEMDQHMIRINEKCGFLTGAGAIAHFLDAYYSGPNTGPVQGAKVLGRLIGSVLTGSDFQRKLFRSIQTTVKIDGRELEPKDFNLFLACSIREAGLGFTPTPRAYDKPGHFHFIASNAKTSSLAIRLPSMWLGRDLSHPLLYHNGPAAKVTITPLERIRWMVDGEMYDTDQPIRYSAGPIIKMVAPPGRGLFRPNKFNPTPGKATFSAHRTDASKAS